MQAIVCDVGQFKISLKKNIDQFCLKDVIGWRNDSRKLIVFSTDAGFHYAGDGRVCNKYIITIIHILFPLDLVGWYY
jgi:hypothetical protein